MKKINININNEIYNEIYIDSDNEEDEDNLDDLEWAKDSEETYFFK